ncbi:hypothetical protein [Pseudomonas sp. NPDC087804]|uniref:hypothetical protein n=1 Tax=Pseudomonas sp. NPDC087804 TaxID=3364449 RepID=UPI00381CB42F
MEVWRNSGDMTRLHRLTSMKPRCLEQVARFAKRAVFYRSVQSTHCENQNLVTRCLTHTSADDYLDIPRVRWSVPTRLMNAGQQTNSINFTRVDTSASNANHFACREATNASLSNIGQVSNVASNYCLGMDSIYSARVFGN